MWFAVMRVLKREAGGGVLALRRAARESVDIVVSIESRRCGLGWGCLHGQ